jgi:hypothetical protein
MLTEGSTKPVSEARRHSGIVPVMRYSLRDLTDGFPSTCNTWISSATAFLS